MRMPCAMLLVDVADECLRLTCPPQTELEFYWQEHPVVQFLSLPCPVRHKNLLLHALVSLHFVPAFKLAQPLLAVVLVLFPSLLHPMKVTAIIIAKLTATINFFIKSPF